MGRTQMIVEILHSVYAALCNEENWVKFSSAQDANGGSVDIDSHYACSFCLTGAITAAQRTLGYSLNEREAVRSVVAYAIQKEFPSIDHRPVADIVKFNDFALRRHSHIVRVLERAIALFESRARLEKLEREVFERDSVVGHGG